MSSPLLSCVAICLPLPPNRARRPDAKCSLTCKTAIDTCPHPRLRAPRSSAHPSTRALCLGVHRSRRHRDCCAGDGRSNEVCSNARRAHAARIGRPHQSRRRFRSELRFAANSVCCNAGLCSMHRCGIRRHDQVSSRLGISQRSRRRSCAGTEGREHSSNGCGQLLGASNFSVRKRSVLVVAYGVSLRGRCERRSYADDFFGRNRVSVAVDLCEGAPC